jgi:hypothetical protein
MYALPRALAIALLLTTVFLAAQDLQLPTTYEIDLQLALSGRSARMGGSSEISGTAANEIGDDVFHKLISAGFSQPFPWKLTLVGNDNVNATSTAGGQLYVYGGMLPLLSESKGLWAATLSHEVAHTGRRHQVRDYLQLVRNQQMINYYRARIAAGDKSANWALLGFRIAAPIALKKMERDQEHDADTQGMLLMARAGYHPDYVFALHHLLRMHTGEQSKFAAFFSDHPRWETRDQRSEKSYADALAEYERLWRDPETSPGGAPPVVAFFTAQPSSKENKSAETADVTISVFCRNTKEPVEVDLRFLKDNHPVHAQDASFADHDGNLAFREKAECSEKTENSPILLHLPANVVSENERKLHAIAFVANGSEVIAESKSFDVHFPKMKH